MAYCIIGTRVINRSVAKTTLIYSAFVLSTVTERRLKDVK